MVLFALIFGSTANWPWIVDLVLFGLLTISCMSYKLLSMSSERDNPISNWFVSGAMYCLSVTPALFCCYYLFCNWSSGPWWYYLFFALGIIVGMIPGGCSIMTLIVSSMGLIHSIPVFVWIIAIVIDILNLIALFGAINVKNKQRY